MHLRQDFFFGFLILRKTKERKNKYCFFFANLFLKESIFTFIKLSYLIIVNLKFIHYYYYYYIIIIIIIFYVHDNCNNKKRNKILIFMQTL